MTPRLLLAPLMTGDAAAVWVTAEELAVAATFRSDRRRLEYLTWRAVVRRELGREIEIAYNAVGAPILLDSDLHISVAHSGERVAVCISGRPCAVDIESLERDFSRVRSRYMTPSEGALSGDRLLPAVVWCAKEALYKLAGKVGLDLLDDLRIERVDLPAGQVTGRIENGEPVELSVCRDSGYLIVFVL